MKKKYLISVFSVLMAVCLVFTCTGAMSSAFAAPATTKAQSLEDKRADIEKKLAETDKKLKELGEESKETEEYIKVLDEKLQYLKEQFDLAKSEAESVEKKVNSLEDRISKNSDEIAEIKVEISALEDDVTRLNDEFATTYEMYCKRIRALYISGNRTSSLGFLLESDGLQNLLTRYEMICAVSKQDGELLESVKEQTQKIVSVKNELDEKKDSLTSAQTQLENDKTTLESEKTDLLKKQEDMDKQREVIEEQQLEANQLLKELNDKTQHYGEYRDITKEELEEIDAAIEEADKKYPVTTTTTTTTKKTTTTTKKTTAKTTTKNNNSTTNKSTTTTKKTTTTTKKTTTESKYISLTYPCPAYTTITCGFGAYAGHTGCDFSTQKHENQKIVASEAGTVILVKNLNYSYGHYIVIRHDKTTSSGKTVYTLYAHNNDIIVSEGQHVSKGKQIAYSGSTGNSTGPHCHFEVRVGGSSQSYAVNPVYYLP
ncbi:MAG: murein hydrolase activator EnvC family protein [Eubacterium sp.]